MRKRTLLLVALLSCLAAPVDARPPTVPPFMRMDELGPKLAELQAKLKRAEAFAKKIRQERMIIRFGERAERFEGRKFTDKGFVEDILVKWSAVQKSEQECDAEHIRILELLPKALRARYDDTPIPKAERYQASKVLVKGLKSKHDIIRRISIRCLDEIYGRTLLYRHDASPGQRQEKARKWQKTIDELRR